MSLPLDSDGFLRRACPACAGEFKWRHDEPDELSEAEVEPGGYYCPLCGCQAPLDQWHTPEQVAFIEQAVLRAAQRSLADAFRNSSAVSFSSGGAPPEPSSLSEPNDMLAVGPPCHPEEPVKIPEGTSNPLFCLVCGAQYAF